MFVKGNMKWQAEYSVSGIGSLSNFSIVNTLTHAPDPVSFCSPPCVGQEEVHPQNGSWRHHPCQNHSNFTTHGLCEHNTGARWKTARRTNSVTAWAIWDECSRLILLIRTFTPAWFGFPSYQTRHTWTRRISLINLKRFWLLIFSLCRATCHVCIWQKYSRLRMGNKRTGRSKMGADQIGDRKIWVWE